MSKHRRKIFIVDEPFQIKYSLLLGLAGFVVSLVAGVVFYYHINAQDSMLLPYISPEASVFLEYQKKLLLVKISAVTVVITLFMFMVGVVISNKISGAVFSIRRSLKNIADKGDFSTRFRIRGHDELKDLVMDLNNAMERLDVEHSKTPKLKK